MQDLHVLLPTGKHLSSGLTEKILLKTGQDGGG